MNTRVKNSGPIKKWYLLAGVLFLLGMISLGWEALERARSRSTTVHLGVSGKVTFTLEQPGEYTIFDWERMDQSPGYLPVGMTIRIVHEDTQKEIPVQLIPAEGEGVDLPKKYSRADFTVRIPGRYIIETGNVRRQHTLMVSTLPGKTRFVCYTISSISWIGAIIVFVTARLRRKRALYESQEP